MRQLIIRCDADHEGQRPEASIIDIAIRVTDLNDPAKATVVTGTVEVCAEHGRPVTDLAELIEAYGAALDDDARQGLAKAMKSPAKSSKSSSKGLGGAKFVKCSLCPPNRRPIRVGSRYDHALRLHKLPYQEIEFTAVQAD